MLSIEKRLKNIINYCDENHITAYQIGNATHLNTSGVQRILDGKVEKPRNKTLVTIESYLEKFKNSINLETAEPSLSYSKTNSIETQIASEVEKRLEKQLSFMQNAMCNIMMAVDEIQETLEKLVDKTS